MSSPVNRNGDPPDPVAVVLAAWASEAEAANADDHAAWQEWIAREPPRGPEPGSGRFLHALSLEIKAARQQELEYRDQRHRRALLDWAAAPVTAAERRAWGAIARNVAERAKEE